MRRIMVTGGMGFIGSNFVQYWLRKYPEDMIVVLDAFTYAAREMLHLEDSEHLRLIIEKCDIRDQAAVQRALRQYCPEHVFHFAAESHVCRSITGPKDFVYTNALGTWNLLEECRYLWTTNGGSLAGKRFIHISTDEVFGQLGENDKPFHEGTQIKPRSPYAASKAASDLFALSYHETYGLDVIVTNCSNNFGPNQHEEKLIPKTILSLLAGKPMTVYGDGRQKRDWLYVGDHCSALDTVFHKGKSGERYCIGGDMQLTNLGAMEEVYRSLKKVCPEFKDDMTWVFTSDRPTDDYRYDIDSSKLKALGWTPDNKNFTSNLNETVRWYIQHGYKQT